MPKVGSRLGTHSLRHIELSSTLLEKYPAFLRGLAAEGSHPAPANSSLAHLERAVPGGAGAGAPPARRSSSHPPACCSGPEIHLQTASAGLSPIAEEETEKGEAGVG